MKMPWVLALIVLTFASGTMIAHIGESRIFDVAWRDVIAMWLWSAGFFVLGHAAGKIAK